MSREALRPVTAGQHRPDCVLSERAVTQTRTATAGKISAVSSFRISLEAAPWTLPALFMVGQKLMPMACTEDVS